MTTLTDFLLARIAEDEAVAREFDTELAKEFGTTESWLSSEITLGATGYMEYPALLIDSTRVLAECEAKRRIVEALVDAEDAVAQFKEPDVTTYPSYWQEWGNRHALRLAVELLALPYADHPDYREEWRP